MIQWMNKAQTCHEQSEWITAAAWEAWRDEKWKFWRGFLVFLGPGVVAGSNREGTHPEPWNGWLPGMSHPMAEGWVWQKALGRVAIWHQDLCWNKVTQKWEKILNINRKAEPYRKIQTAGQHMCLTGPKSEHQLCPAVTWAHLLLLQTQVSWRCGLGWVQADVLIGLGLTSWSVHKVALASWWLPRKLSCLWSNPAHMDNLLCLLFFLPTKSLPVNDFSCPVS